MMLIEDVDEAGPAESCAQSAIAHPPVEALGTVRLRASRRPVGARLAASSGDPAFEGPDLATQGFRLPRQGPSPGSQVPIVLPPVQSDLLGLVDRAHDQPDPYGE